MIIFYDFGTWSFLELEIFVMVLSQISSFFLKRHSMLTPVYSKFDEHSEFKIKK